MSEQTLSYFQEQIHHCQLCPRMCSIDRTAQTGFCQAPAGAVAARAALHFWEEPCISGTRGSGTVFFSGCTLRCCFCQNYKISREMYGKTLTTAELADVFLRLQEQGANNISLVTATHFLPWIIPALDLAKKQLHIPIVYNCGGYERIETILALKDYVDIWLPDFKYENSELSARYSQAPFYFQTAAKAIQQMIRQTGAPHVCSIPGESGPVMDRGVIIRHLVLPGQKDDSIRILHWIAQNLPKDSFYISLMSQYTPYEKNSMYPELNRRITSYEYQKVVDAALDLGLTMGFMQEKSSAKEEYTPAFDLEGL
ncbi:radical SAM protein [Clostridium sp. OM02-18AC]|uniref:radical SAM protein n=1 Tax=Clostridium sp. OM02-18AC TaxID=2292311 RepID=UPI000E4A6D40|nr:radical SAM protein [Clostridium sp. OM02-18AC]RHV65930.1 radical SAM protein [Clostridium sp. OM02-18AC]